MNTAPAPHNLRVMNSTSSLGSRRREMQTTLALRKFSLNSMFATFAVICALAAGAVGGYLLKGHAASAVPTAAQQPLAAQTKHVAPPVDLPEENGNAADTVDRAIAQTAVAGIPPNP